MPCEETEDGAIKKNLSEIQSNHLRLRKVNLVNWILYAIKLFRMISKKASKIASPQFILLSWNYTTNFY
jgi:hypothetical protein